ncbi:MAG: type I-E CRISPR-associated protein Cas7/Cse4/CasC [Chloroflexi bacterium]|nr:type I-E CRISPR-associated protein Cas7/Cse4/CasC [Chloroflexota bacterium]
MFVQIHMLQSVPPGNVNRDDTGQPKKCLFGGVTRGRISSQCLKRNIRHSIQFKEAFGEDLASRTEYLPQMVADELKDAKFEVPQDELEEIMKAITGKFSRSEPRSGTDDDGDETDGQVSAQSKSSGTDRSGRTPQLVFFPPPFAGRIAGLIGAFRASSPEAYKKFIGQRNKATKDDDAATRRFINSINLASRKLTVDIALFGRMTTSDLVENVEAATQVAHAISTHEVIIESDYFTAMDDKRSDYASTQMGATGAAFLGSGDTETFFNSAVYYKYLNLDLDAVGRHLPSLSPEQVTATAGVLVSAATLTHPTGKQNSFANATFPELVLVETSRTKRPVSYANAFLQAVEGGATRNLMAESANALGRYVDEVAIAFSPSDVTRVLLSVGAASITLQVDHQRVKSLDELVRTVGLMCIPEKVATP